MQRKYLVFFIYSYSFKKRKREEQCIQSSLKGCKEKRLLRDTIFFNEKYTKEETFSVKNGI